MQYRENNSGLHILEIEITRRCNLNCIHCYAGGNQKVDLHETHIKNIIEQANEIGVNRLVLTGGEPLLDKNVFSYAEYAKKIGIPEVALLTNGTLLDEEKAAHCQVFSGVQMSLDGVPEKAGVLRKNYFPQLERAIKLLHQHRIPITLYATINKDNLNDIDLMIAYATKQNCTIAFNCLIPIKKDLVKLVPSTHELKKAFTDIVSQIKENPLVRLSHHFRFLVDKQRMAEFQQSLEGGIRGGCLAGIAAAYITADGDFLPCPFIRVSCGNIKTQSLNDIWNNSPILGVLRERTAFKGKCGKCKFVNCCGGCRASSLYKYGELNNSDDNCFLLEEIENDNS